MAHGSFEPFGTRLARVADPGASAGGAWLRLPGQWTKTGLGSWLLGEFPMNRIATVACCVLTMGCAPTQLRASCPWATPTASVEQVIATLARGEVNEPLLASLETADDPLLRSIAYSLREKSQTGDHETPRLIWYHQPEPRDLPADERWSTIPSVLAAGTVAVSGTFEDPALVSGTGNSALDRLLLEHAACALFLPAVQHGVPVESRARLVFHWPIVGGPPSPAGTGTS